MDDKDGASVLVINSTAPELNHLAAALAARGDLGRYVRPYVHRGDASVGLASRVPVLGRLYAELLGRRQLPAALRGARVQEAAVLSDLLCALARRLPGASAGRLAERLHWRIQCRLGRAGARWADRHDTVVANYLVAEPAFRRAVGRRVLNHPIAHHRAIQRLVAEEAEREPAFASTLPDWSRVPPWVEPRLEREIADADLLLLGSEFARRTFIEAGVDGGKLAVVPYGVDPAWLAWRPRAGGGGAATADGLNVLYVGQIGQRKGISYLLRGYRAFCGPGTTLTLVGGFYNDARPFEPWRGLFQHVPPVAHQQLAAIYRSADVFVFPTLLEGLGMVVIEAMACGLPVITTDCGPGELVRDGVDGFIVPIRDSEAITDRLVYLRDHPAQRLEMGRNARERAQWFTWDAYGSRIAALLLDGQRPSSCALPAAGVPSS